MTDAALGPGRTRLALAAARLRVCAASEAPLAPFDRSFREALIDVASRPGLSALQSLDDPKSRPTICGDVCGFYKTCRNVAFADSARFVEVDGCLKHRPEAVPVEQQRPQQLFDKRQKKSNFHPSVLSVLSCLVATLPSIELKAQIYH